MTMTRHVLLAALLLVNQGLALQVPKSGALDPEGSEGYPAYNNDAESNLLPKPQGSSTAAVAVFSDGETDSVPSYMRAHDVNYDGNLVDKVAVEVSYDGDLGPGYRVRAITPTVFEKNVYSKLFTLNPIFYKINH